MVKALFLDRDGTINKYGSYIFKKEDFIFIEGVIEFIKMFNDNGWKVFVVSNQAGIARGYYTENDVQDLQRWVDTQLNEYGAHIDEWVYCPHHPEYGIGKYKVDCKCRKPKTGMVDYLCAKYNIDRSKSLLVGDKPWDIECGENAGISSYLLQDENYCELLNTIILDGKICM